MSDKKTPPRTWHVDSVEEGEGYRVGSGAKYVQIAETHGACSFPLDMISVHVADLPALIAVLQEAQAAVEVADE